jgi:hypothetical protein
VLVFDLSEQVKWLGWFGRTWGQLTVTGFSFAAAGASATAAWLSVRVSRQNVRFQRDAEKRKRDVDLFDERFKVYRDFRTYIQRVRNEGDLWSNWEFLFSLGEIRERSYFLYPLDVDGLFQALRLDVEDLDRLTNEGRIWTPDGVPTAVFTPRMYAIQRRIIGHHNDEIQNAMKASLMIGDHYASSVPASDS